LCGLTTAAAKYKAKKYCSAQTGKGKVHPRTDHEGPEREKRYSSILKIE
jgi:hypothetical protein